MCGIFGFALKKPITLTGVFRILQKMEIHKYPDEKTTLGGYGAGIAILLPDGSVFSEKVGKISNSPVTSLMEIAKPSIKRASVLLAHVRMPSPEFLTTAQYRETAQPYVVEFEPNLTIVSAHNGKMSNYKKIRAELGKEHVFESEKYELIDSEVLPHYFEEILSETEEEREALDAFFNNMRGQNTLSMLQITDEDTYMHFVHKGKTRGLTIWTNPQGEIVFSSRKEPVVEEYARMLTKGEFIEKTSIQHKRETSLKITYPIDWEIQA